MKRLALTFIALIIAAVAAAVALVLIHRPEPAPAVPHVSTSTASPSPTPNPLGIAAIRAHTVAPSTITTTATLAPRGGCLTSTVSFTVDGLTEHALLQAPSTARPAAGYPVIILAHGYIAPAGYQTTGTDYQTFMNAFCGAGYAIFKLDYRGNGQSQGSPTVGDLEPGYTYDVLGLTASLPSRSDLNAKNVAWFGHSMGGAVVLRASVASHNLPVKAVVLASGVVGSLEDVVENWPAASLPADLAPVKASLTTTYGTPASNPGFYHDISAINYVSAIPAPVSINHGTADAIVPILFSQHLDAALTAANKPHVYYTYPGGDHQYSQAGSGAAFLANNLAFLSKNMQ